MKKMFLVAFAMVAMLVSNASAVDSTGCGLGSQVFKGKSGPFYQVIAVTTNMTFGNQTFAITSGTSGCDPEGTITGGKAQMAMSFIENNMEQFAIDASSGNGETVETIAGILDVDSEVLGRKIQENFTYLFSNENIQAVELTQKLMEITEA